MSSREYTLVLGIYYLYVVASVAPTRTRQGCRVRRIICTIVGVLYPSESARRSAEARLFIVMVVLLPG